MIGLGVGVTSAPQIGSVVSGGDVTAPVISTFAAGAQIGLSQPFAVSITEANGPIDLFVVGVPASATAPIASEIIAGEQSGGAAAPIVGTFIKSIGGASSISISNPPPGTFDYYAVARDPSLKVSAIASDLGVVTTAATIVPEPIIIFEGQDQTDGTGLAAAGTVDTSALTGDHTLIFMIGTSDKTSTFFGGSPEVAATKLDQDAGGAGGRMSLYKLDVVGPGSAAFPWRTVFASSESFFLFSCVAVLDAEITLETDVVYNAAGGDASFSRDISKHGSLLLGFSAGLVAAFETPGGPEWSRLTQQTLYDPPSDNDGSAIAWLCDVDAGVYIEGVSDDGAGTRAAHGLLAFTHVNATTASNAVTNWTLEDAAASSGTVARIDVQSKPYLAAHRVDHYELERQLAGGTDVIRVLGGAGTNYVRLVDLDQNASTTCRIRAVFQDTSVADGSVYVSGDWSGDLTVATTTAAERVTIEADKTSCLVGEAVYLKANSDGFETLRPAHDLAYQFDCAAVAEQGDFQFLPDSFLSVYGSRSRTRAYLSIISYTPQSAGDMTVTCKVLDRAQNTDTGTITLTASDPLAVFDPSDIYAVSAGSNYSGVPVGANQHTTLAAAVAAIPSTGQALVMLDASENHGDGTLANFTGLAPDRLMITSYGTGRATLISPIRSNSQVAIGYNVDSNGGYDPTDPFSITDWPGAGIDFTAASKGSWSSSRVSGWMENMLLSDPGNIMCVYDVEITDWGNFGFFQDEVGQRALNGVHAHQNPGAWRAEGKTNTTDNATVGFFADHGPYRTSRVFGDGGIGNSVFVSNTSWASDTIFQPPIRWYGDGVTDRPYVMHNAHLITEGGDLAVKQTSGGGGLASNTPQDFVIDGIYHINSNQPGKALAVRIGGATIKNFVIVQPQTTEVAPELLSGTRVMIEATDDVPNPAGGLEDNRNNPVRLISGTVVDLRATADQGADDFIPLENDLLAPLADFTYENIIEYAPRFDIPDVGDMPLDLSAQFTPAYVGQYLWDNTAGGAPGTVAAQTPDLTLATDAESTATFAPQSGSVAYQTGVEADMCPTDIRGYLRPVTGASKGAYDPGGVAP